ncbi:hypothetical protein BHM03_00005142 [Ensete ventricosum]|uniref:Uncharacterized protein n=1 Tax=Ensete ventricosum TaxID=4639 RepID=A0A445MB43_ENSVE|nr:hypothetical protein BHM03_00005142 [Ensete ventricosum]
MFAAPWFIAVLAQSLGGLFLKFVSCQFFCCKGSDGIRGTEGFGIASRKVTLDLQASWFNHSSCSRAKEMAAIRVYGYRAFTSPCISDFKPSMKFELELLGVGVLSRNPIRNDGSRSSLSIGPGFGRSSGISSEFARRFAEGIGKLARNMLGDYRKKTVELTSNVEGCRIGGRFDLHSKKIGNGRQCASTRRTREEFARRRLRLTGRLSGVVEKLAGKDHRTRSKNVEGCRISGRYGLHPKKIDSGRQSDSRIRTQELM